MVIARIQAEETLRNSRNEWQRLFNSMQDFLFIIDTKGRILDVNQQVIRCLGYTRDELAGRIITMIHPPDQQAEANSLLIEIENNHCDSHSLPLQTKYGDVIPAETRFTSGRGKIRKQFLVFATMSPCVKKLETELQTANSNLTTHLNELKQRNSEVVQISEMSALLQVCVKTEETYQVIQRHLKLIFPKSKGPCM